MTEKNLDQTESEEIMLNSRGYKLTKQVGEGSHSKVYLSMYRPVDVNPAIERYTVLACKMIDVSKATKDFVQKFLPREIDILTKVQHPYIIIVQSIFQIRSKYFIFMQYAENGDLLELIQKKGEIGESQARVWLRQLTLAVKYLHTMEIAHRDLKCENVLITADDNVKLADFGFARYVVDPQGTRVLSNTYCGSLPYAAPEIISGRPYNPKKADVWSMGVILYVMLNKAMPFEGSNLRRLYNQQMSRSWKFQSKVESSLSKEVKQLIIILLEPTVKKRGTLVQVLKSEWIAMDSNLKKMSSAEKAAAARAREERRRIHSLEGKPLSADS